MFHIPYCNCFFDKITITGHSMNNTLQNNQTVILNTLAYSLKAPERYDLIAFKTGKKIIPQYM